MAGVADAHDRDVSQPLRYALIAVAVVVLAAAGFGAAVLLRHHTNSGIVASSTTQTTLPGGGYHYVPPPVPTSSKTASFLRPWHAGNPEAKTLAGSLQPLTAAHPVTTSGVYWFGRSLHGLVPYLQARMTQQYWQARIYYGPEQSATGVALEVESDIVRPSIPQRILDPFHPHRFEFSVDPTGKMAAKYKKLPHHPVKGGFYVILPTAEPTLVVFRGKEMVTLTSLNTAAFPLSTVAALAAQLRLYK